MSRRSPAPSPEPTENGDGPHRRNRARPIKVYVTDDERAALLARSEIAGMSLSGYLVAAGLNHTIRSMLDHDAAMKLLRVSADQGRFGGLLKKWLGERRGEGASVADVNAGLREARAIQTKILETLSQVRRGRS